MIPFSEELSKGVNNVDISTEKRMVRENQEGRKDR